MVEHLSCPMHASFYLLLSLFSRCESILSNILIIAEKWDNEFHSLCHWCCRPTHRFYVVNEKKRANLGCALGAPDVCLQDINLLPAQFAYFHWHLSTLWQIALVSLFSVCSAIMENNWWLYQDHHKGTQPPKAALLYLWLRIFIF